jgi:AraC-like DNA-binding protein
MVAEPAPTFGGSNCLIVCGVTPEQAAKIHRAAGTRAHVRIFGETQLAHEFARAASAVDAVVIGESLRASDSPVRFVERMTQDLPRTPVIAYCRAGIEHSSRIRSLVLAGVHELIFVGRDDEGVALRTILASARRECAAEAVFALLETVLPRESHRFVRAALTNPRAAASLNEFAQLLGLNRKTLFKMCTARSLPAPSELLMWCRILLMAYMHEKSARTLESIALELEFPSATALRNRVKAYTGLRTSDLRGAGGAPVVVACLRTRLAGISARMRRGAVA